MIGCGMAKQKRTFSKEFKDEVVKLILTGGKTQAQACRDMDLKSGVVSLWVKQAKAEAGGNRTGVLTGEERRELAQLRKDNRELRMEREILKKATAFFAKLHA